MTTQTIEIVTYKVANPAEGDRQREAARVAAAGLPGYAGWLPLAGEDRASRADIVVWDDMQSAQSAAQIVGASPDFAGFRSTISEIGGMWHYAAPTNGLALMQAGDGIEIGRFRLRDGVREQDLRAAHSRMIAHHLSLQPGWRGQRLVRLEDGTFLDIAFASTQEQSKFICSQWAGNAECEAFLSLIEPIAMEFGAFV